MQLRIVLKNYRHYLRRFILRKSTGGRVSIGLFTYGAPKVRWWGEPADLYIGKFCSIADNVEIFLGGNHRTDWITTFPFSSFRRWDAIGIPGHPSTRGDVIVGNDVWLGSGCRIHSGVTIGDGAVIAAAAVVTKDVPPYAIAAGNPAKTVKYRFSQEQIDQLLKIAWWNWPEDRIRAEIPKLLSTEVRDLKSTF